MGHSDWKQQVHEHGQSQSCGSAMVLWLLGAAWLPQLSSAGPSSCEDTPRQASTQLQLCHLVDQQEELGMEGVVREIPKGREESTCVAL